jgi:hypothetical protein
MVESTRRAIRRHALGFAPRQDFLVPLWLVLILSAFATFRLTRLVILDTIANRPRTWLSVHLPTWSLQLLICHWCVGFWIAGAVLGWNVGLGVTPFSWRAFPVEWLAIAALAGLIGSRQLTETSPDAASY